MIASRPVDYDHDGQAFEGRLLVDDGHAGPQPCVLVYHAWDGRSDAQEKFAGRLVELGYAAFAVDLYGRGKRGSTPEECQALMGPLVGDRAALRGRLLRTVEVVGELAEVDATNLAAVGFCFGGLCVLDLARAGAPLKGVASFHGLFTAPGLPIASPVKPRIIAYHGWDDPMVPPADVVALGQELTAAGADWQIHAFGGAMHGFMAEGANNPGGGIVYNERAARRAWTGLKAFLAEALG